MALNVLTSQHYLGRLVDMRILESANENSGVASFMKPPQWLKDCDIVKIEIEKIGHISNVMVFEAK